MHNQDKKPKEQPANDQTKKDKQVYPESTSTGPQPDETSMSNGNLVNNPDGRSRSRDLHTKISITGNDNDGQAN